MTITSSTDRREARQPVDAWQAFERLVREHHDALRLFVFRMVHDWGSVDDVLQEAYLRAFRAFPAFSARPDSPKGWLYRIVYRCALDEIGRRKRWDARHARPESEDWLPERRAVEDKFSDQAALKQALSELQPDKRAAVILVDGLGFDYETASTVLGVRRGTIASRLNKARNLLRASLEKHGIEERTSA